MGVETNLRELISDLLHRALVHVQDVGELPDFDVPTDVPVDASRHEAHGDYGSPVCLGLARQLHRSPIEIARAVAAVVEPVPYIAEVNVAPPGFINFTLDAKWLVHQVPAILNAGEHWGNVSFGAGKRVQVEFVSANPTGPITIGSARNAVIGDSLAAVLEAAGYAVDREYYVNDAGSKVRHFGGSILSRYAGLFGLDIPFPEKGYPGDYVTDLAELAKAEFGRRFLNEDVGVATRALGHWGIEQVLKGVKKDLSQLRVEFNTWFHEKELYRSGLFDEMMARLRAGGYVAEYDNATWFQHEDLPKDAVLIRSPEVIPVEEDRPTYLASDVAYLWHKLKIRGFDTAIYVWGADHHGDVPRVKAAAKALGLDTDRIVIILYQMVTLRRGEQEIRMSKSSGEFVTLRELIEEVGTDPIRFMMLTRTVDVTLDFDLDLAVEQSERNPVFYVQYAHTRIAGVIRRAEELGWDVNTLGDPSLLTHPSELALIRKMLSLPEIITLAASNLAPHHLTGYATELASLFHGFYRDCRIVSEDPDDLELSQARLMLARAAKSVLAKVLHMMGMTAPEQM
jgi:arginyl-tRNA synthetase